MALLRACRDSRSKPSLGKRGALLFVESGDPPWVDTETYRHPLFNSTMNLLCLNLGTVNQHLRRVGSGPVSKPRTKVLRSGTTLSCDGFARTLFETSRWDMIGIRSVLRRTNGSDPAACSFPIFDLR